MRIEILAPRVVLLLSILGVLFGCPLSPIQAQSEPPNTANLYHWTYSAAFGNGVYQMGSDRVLVIRIMPSFELLEFADERATLNLKLPFTIGIQDVDVGVYRNSGVDDFLKTLSFVPGLDVVYYPFETWRLKPFGHYGWGTEIGDSESAQIYFGGLNSRYTFDFDLSFDTHLLNGIQWLGYHPTQGDSDRFSRLITGLEWNIPLQHTTLGGKQAYLRPHIAHFWYFDHLGFKQIENQAIELKQEFEIGMAIGQADKMSLGFFHFDRFGLAYRTSENVQGIRLYFSSIMD